MIHPTRTNLLQLKAKVASVTNSVAILKARRQTLIRELLASVRPFLRSRDAIRLDYGQPLVELQLAKGHEGQMAVEALAAAGERPLGVDIAEKDVMGVHYRELTVWGAIVRSLEERNYGYAVTSPHLEGRSISSSARQKRCSASPCSRASSRCSATRFSA
jgi:V/A-type H+-transporting ATPase subunit D